MEVICSVWNIILATYYAKILYSANILWSDLDALSDRSEFTESRFSSNIARSWKFDEEGSAVTYILLPKFKLIVKYVVESVEKNTDACKDTQPQTAHYGKFEICTINTVLNHLDVQSHWTDQYAKLLKR